MGVSTSPSGTVCINKAFIMIARKAYYVASVVVGRANSFCIFVDVLKNIREYRCLKTKVMK